MRKVELRMNELEKYKTIKYLIGHYEYTNAENHPLFLEKDKNYRTIKHDPDMNFMESLRSNFSDLRPLN